MPASEPTSVRAGNAPLAEEPVLSGGGRVGVLLVNLGTPDGTEPAPMRRYLREFLMDRRVIEWPRIVWYPVLFGIVLNTRPKKSGALYKSIWNNERDESPLLTFTRTQAEKLATALEEKKAVTVDYAMRYGNPSIESVTRRMMDAGCERIVMFPLYPQYSATTTASVNDKFFAALAKMRLQPSIRVVPPYYDEPAYIDALAHSIESHVAGLDFEPEVVIASYHGIPQSYARRGDPYPEQCYETSRLLRQRLGWDEKKLMTCFQSRFGPEEWLQPYTDKTLEQLGADGVKSVSVFNPGFVSDCLETLEEIAIEGRESFLHTGGQNYSYIPCLNDSADGMNVLETLVRRELSGWA